MDTLEVDSQTLLTHRTDEGWQGMPAKGMIGHLHLKHMIWTQHINVTLNN